MVENETNVTTSVIVTTEINDTTGALVASDVAPLTMFPRSSETLKQRLFVKRPSRWRP